MAKLVQKTERKVVQARLPIERINQDRLVELFDNIDAGGNTFLEIWTDTVPNMRKTNNRFYGKIIKLAELNVQAGWIYANSVNLQRAREEIDKEFVAEPRRWGEHLVNPQTSKTSKIMIGHTNKAGEYNRYAHLRPLSVKSVTYVWEDTYGSLTENEIAELEPFLVERSKSQTQETAKEIMVTDYNIGNITAMVHNKTLYMLL